MAIFTPADSAALTAALVSCTFGDTIKLTHGVTYSGNFTFPDKGVGSSYITLTTDTLGTLPTKLANYPSNYNYNDETSYRISPQIEATDMPKMLTTNGNAVIRFTTGAHHWKFIGIEITNNGSTDVNVLVFDDSNPAVLADFLSDIWFEKCFAHPFEETGDSSVDYMVRSVTNGWIMGGSNLTWKNCCVEGFTGSYLSAPTTHMPTCGILYGLGLGNITIENNMIEGSTYNTWLGGGGGGFPFIETSASTASGATSTTATLDNVNDLDVGDLITFRVTEISDILVSYPAFPNGTTTEPVDAGYGVGKVTNISGFDVTFSPLTNGCNFRILHVKFNTGVSGGTFTITYFGQTTAPITFPQQTITGATNANPIVITCASHGLINGDRVRISGVGGNTNANGDRYANVLDANTFALYDATAENTIGGNGNYTSGGIFCSRNKCEANIYNALIALSNLDASDITTHDPYFLYMQAPTFGPHILFANSTDTFLLSDGDITIDGTNLTGSGSVACRLEHWWSEGYSEVDLRIAPSAGALAAWDGIVPSNYSIKQNIYSKPPLWDAWVGKGLGQMKTGQNLLFEGNIFDHSTRSFIFEVKNQNGNAPWSVIQHVMIRSNLWTNCLNPVAFAPTDGANRCIQANDITFTNNLCLTPREHVEGAFLGNATLGGTNFTFTHNTMFNSLNTPIVNAVVGTLYDGPEAAGFSQLKDWTWRDNIMIYGFLFMGGTTPSLPLPPLYNHGNILDYFDNLDVNTNAIWDKGDLYANPSWQNFFGVFTYNPDNWLISAADGVASIEFVNPASDLGMTGDYRLQPSSPYAAGNAREASDHTDMGCHIDTLVTALGFNPFGPTETGGLTMSGSLTIGGIITIGPGA